MANRITELNNEGEPEINPFIFTRSTCPDDVRIKEFRQNDWEWAEFIMRNRDKSQNPPYAHNFDIVIGPVADSSVDPVIKEYREEFGEAYLEPDNLKVLASRLKYPGTPYIQYCFCTTKALNYLIRD